MDTAFSSAIEKIRLAEQEEEIKLKEKREYESVVLQFNRAIKDATIKIEKSHHEQKALNKKIDSLRTEIILEKIRRDALAAQVDDMKKELEDLTNQYNASRTKALEQRSEFYKEINSASGSYEVYPLLAKPACSKAESMSTNKKSDVNYPLKESEIRLQAAIDRRTRAIAERDRLKEGFDNDEEYVRINDALQYSLTMIAGLKKL